MKKFGKIIVPIAIVIILAAFAGIIYYVKVVKPAKEIDEEAGYNANEYIELGKYTGFNYLINQKKFDDLVKEKTFSSESVSRAAKEGDEIEFSYTGYVDGKKVKDLSQENVAVETNQKENAVYSKFTDALIGKKKGDTVTVSIPGKDASIISKDKKKYDGTVTFKLKVEDVNKVDYAKVTDDWVKNESNEEVDTVKDFYDVVEAELDETATADLWQKAIDNATMTNWPPELYNKVKEEEEADARYNADQWDMNLKEWYAMNNETEDSLKKEYLNQVKSTLVMWAIVKEEHITCSDSDIEERYQELFEELKEDGEYKTLDDVKKDYSKSEIREAVYLDKAQQFVYDNSNVKKTYKVPKIK